jgi:hypothetical protein
MTFLSQTVIFSETFKGAKQMKKIYECFWGEGYYQNNRSHLEWHEVDLNEAEFFTEDKGYHPHDVENIRALDIGQSLNLSCITGEHWIRRVE